MRFAPVLIIVALVLALAAYAGRAQTRGKSKGLLKPRKVKKLVKQSIAATRARIKTATRTDGDCVDTHKKGTAFCENKKTEKEAQLKRWCRGKQGRTK